MSLPAGTRIGPYEVLLLAGSGGMGDVYRARDTRLGRDVALKVLPEALAGETDRLARFRREAHVIAALNHPNIAQVYDFDETPDALALAMEFVEGQTLAEVIDRVRAGAPAGERRFLEGLSLDDVLQIARQITLALEAAHEQGIVHRDLKPSNVMVRDDGTVKVLDFGIAKALVADTASAPLGSDITPTITALTALGAGVVLGTPAYMAPEQVRGRPVDKRADIWAFGCVVFELLSGTRIFEGEDMSTTFSNVLRTEPDFGLLPADVPPYVRDTLRMCLKKDPKQRLADVRDVRLALDGAFRQPDAVAVAPTVRPRWQRIAGAAAGLLLAAAVGALGVWLTRPAAVRAPIHFDEQGSPDANFHSPARRNIAISPDGARLGYATPAGFYLRELGQPDAHLLEGIEGLITDPLFSPDGRILVYAQGNQLRRIPVAGGEAVSLAAVTSLAGLSWSDDGQIVYAQADGIWRVPADGGTPERLVEPNPEERLLLPQLLPGGEWLIATSRKGTASQIVALPLGTKERKVVVPEAVHARYVNSGHLLYLLPEGGLLAEAFDPVRLETHGGAMPVLGNLARATNGEGQFSVAANGSLIYVPDLGRESRRLIWVNRAGVEVGALGVSEDGLESPSLSPNERFVVFSAVRGSNRDVIRYDIQTTTHTVLSTSPQRDDRPMWNADGSAVAFNTQVEGTRQIVARRADGSGDLETVAALQNQAWLGDWGTIGDFEYVLFDREGTDGGLWYERRRLNSATWEAPTRFLAGPGQVVPKLSPNGEFVAYVTRNPSEIEVAPFPAANRRWKISTDGGHKLRWSRDGRELFYVRSEDLMSVRVSPSGDLNPSKPVRLFSFRGLTAGPLAEASYDVARDGQRFLVVTRPPPTTPSIHVVLNWFAELRKLVQPE